MPPQTQVHPKSMWKSVLKTNKGAKPAPILKIFFYETAFFPQESNSPVLISKPKDNLEKRFFKIHQQLFIFDNFQWNSHTPVTILFCIPEDWIKTHETPCSIIEQNVTSKYKT